MPDKLLPGPRAIALLILICLLASLSRLSAQERPASQKPRPKDFGSSLKKLKWDERKKAAVEQEQAKDARSEAADDVFQIETMLAVFEMLVLDPRGRYITGLGRDDFIISEDGSPQEIATFSLGDGSQLPRSIVLIIDYSGSQVPYLKNSLEAARVLVDRLRPTDRMAIVTDDVELLVAFTSNKEELKKGLEMLGERAAGRSLGRSRQYSALLSTLREMIGEEERPIIIFQTDGDELGLLRSSTGSVLQGVSPMANEFGMGDILAAAEKSRATIYTVIPGIRLLGLPPEKQSERARLGRRREVEAMKRFWDRSPGVMQPLDLSEKYLHQYLNMRLRQQQGVAGVAQLTGGWAEFLEEPEQAQSIYSRIFSGIHFRYVIGLYPLNSERDGKRRKVEIKVRDHPEYTVWGRRSFVVPVS